MERNLNKFVYSQPTSFRLIINHGEKFFYIAVFIGLFITHNKLRGQLLIDVLILIFSLFVVLFFLGKFLKKVIWRIEIDFNSETVKFHLCRSGSSKKIKFQDIEKIVVSGLIIFKVNKKSFLYSTNQYNSILENLNRIKSIQWGKLCSVLGPNRKIRKKFEGPADSMMTSNK